MMSQPDKFAERLLARERLDMKRDHPLPFETVIATALGATAIGCTAMLAAIGAVEIVSP